MVAYGRGLGAGAYRGSAVTWLIGRWYAFTCFARAALVLGLVATASALGHPAGWTVETVAGETDVGDGGPATEAWFDSPRGIAVEASDNLHIADADNGRVRRADAATGVISTVAGTGERGFGGCGQDDVPLRHTLGNWRLYPMDRGIPDRNELGGAKFVASPDFGWNVSVTLTATGNNARCRANQTGAGCTTAWMVAATHVRESRQACRPT